MLSLSTKQGPPFWVPFSFFLSAPVALMAAGLLLMIRADDGVATTFAPSNVALVHLGALGFLVLVITGAFYQLLPVVAGALVPGARWAHAVQGLLFVGTAALAFGQWRTHALAFGWAAGLLACGLLIWLVPSALALFRSRVSHPTVWGLRLALVALVAVVALGLRMALARAGLGLLPDNFLTFRAAHAAMGLLVFVGGLTAAVAWQVVPMFFLTAVPPRWIPTTVLSFVLTSLVCLALVSMLDVPGWGVFVAAAPAAVAVWLVQPAWVARALRGRKRRRRDATLYGWWGSIIVSPLCFGVGAIAAWTTHPTPPIVWGLLVLWGQAGLLVHAMLTRIVPFLVYLHLSAPLVLTHRMRSAKELLRDREVSLGAGLHVFSLVVGVIAAAEGSVTLWRVFGGALSSVAGFLAYELIVAWKRGRTPLAVRG